VNAAETFQTITTIFKDARRSGGRASVKAKPSTASR
jgi:hypothetical protein